MFEVKNFDKWIEDKYSVQMIEKGIHIMMKQ